MKCKYCKHLEFLAVAQLPAPKECPNCGANDWTNSENEKKAFEQNIFWIDDAHTLGIQALDMIIGELKKFGIHITDDQEDEIYIIYYFPCGV
jgi:hypothetical protein